MFLDMTQPKGNSSLFKYMMTTIIIDKALQELSDHYMNKKRKNELSPQASDPYFLTPLLEMGVWVLQAMPEQPSTE